MVGESLDVVLRERGPMPVATCVQLVGSRRGGDRRGCRCGASITACCIRATSSVSPTARASPVSASRSALSRIGARVPVRPPYAAPEGASDIYSLAAIAFEAISGRRMTAAEAGTS